MRGLRKALVVRVVPEPHGISLNVKVLYPGINILEYELREVIEDNIP